MTLRPNPIHTALLHVFHKRHRGAHLSLAEENVDVIGDTTHHHIR